LTSRGRCARPLASTAKPFQDSNIRETAIDSADLLSYCSNSFTLDPGDVLLTGTPWGCSESMDPPRAVEPDERVEAETEGIGVSSSPVVAE
jgi:5-carboxymethyl-2-hydroxymuconate isomerase